MAGLKIKIKKIHLDVKTPGYAYKNDVGMDLYSLEDYILKPKEMKIFTLGFAMEVPAGYAILIKDKSSLAKNSIHTMGGVYDPGYRGEYSVNLINLGKENYIVKKGEKIAQLIIIPVEYAEIKIVEELGNSDRGEGRYGSSGK